MFIAITYGVINLLFFSIFFYHTITTIKKDKEKFQNVYSKDKKIRELENLFNSLSYKDSVHK